MTRTDLELSNLLGALPPRLRERTRAHGSNASPGEGEFVLYWMRTAMRADENPALDTALLLARSIGHPVFVYQGLAEDYPYASDRHHHFILEGARDVSTRLAERGIGYAFHLERAENRGPHLHRLARAATLIVTEEMPVEPLRGWTERLAQGSPAPLLTVDTACIVPMRLAPWPFDRAFEYRKATAELRGERVLETWPAIASRDAPFVPELPFIPVDLSTADLDDLIADCRIDHAVSPVPHSRGGSEAGYRRWDRFRDRGLRQYHRRRNNPLLEGTSRMSPYLHYGMVSPFRLAREAAAEGSAGAEKYLDELLIWRELAYAFCFHQPGHRTVDALPDWAARTLANHEGDPRPLLPSWERLARGRTGDRLWDAAQTHLLRHGELHNNVRMTWGKALLSWSHNAAQALRLLEDLNHRYALDGRDPASYGGILWCLGLFDRPFRPERPILGSVRPRPTSQHARRLDVDRYVAHTSTPSFAHTPSTLVIGGGISGLICARTLADAGLAVQVVDKGRHAGGRAATRSLGDATFDHGAQYFTARDHRFQVYVDAWLHEGVVASWKGTIATLENGRVTPSNGSTRRFVGVPGMSAIGRHLARDLQLDTSTRIVELNGEGEGWSAICEDGRRLHADAVVLAVPAPQAVDLLPRGTFLHRSVSSVQMTPCWAVLASFQRNVDLDVDGAFVSDSPLSWVARNGSKPDRGSVETWVLHASPQWSSEQLESSPELVTRELLGAFAAASGVSLPTVTASAAHRWRYSQAAESLGRDSLYSADLRIGVCGDWCPGARIEGAFLSGVAAAGRLLRTAARLSEPLLTDTQPTQLTLSTKGN